MCGSRKGEKFELLYLEKYNLMSDLIQSIFKKFFSDLEFFQSEFCQGVFFAVFLFFKG